MNDEYTDKHCNFLFDIEHPDGTVAVFRSGLYDINQLELTLPSLEDDIYKSAVCVINSDVGITFEQIKEIYKGSLFPTTESIILNLKKYETEDDTYYPIIPYNEFKLVVEKEVAKYNVSHLMLLFPGRHYYASCRDLPNPTYANSVYTARARAQSFNSGNENTEPTEFYFINNYNVLLQEIFIKLYEDIANHNAITSDMSYILKHLKWFLQMYIDTKGDMYGYEAYVICSMLQRAIHRKHIIIAHIDKELYILYISCRNVQKFLQNRNHIIHRLQIDNIIDRLQIYDLFDNNA